ncbi:FimB/Mfa2 family fimbrial subunit [uncultured Alistipes sp.]|uniref:FimB/Mfa2 family fimbrial subunit n=1 Tax=uncultured Alistipes sp. TaxID=538949 RepID=UPI0025F314E4|nr:FimB/Mfa2 family fimbrial subunit [uncultured Alistipes sp.]
MKKLSKTLCILTSLALSAGCINEDMSDCPPPFNAELTFSYAGDRQEPEMFSRMIDGVTLVVFDRASGRHILDKKVVKADLNRFPGTQLYLPAGDYRIVCWGNAFDDTELLFGSLAEGRVHAPAYGGGSRIATNDHLYYGDYDITVPAAGEVSGDIPFRGAHIDMQVYVKGLGQPSEPAAWPVIEVGNLMPQYDIQMNAIQPFGTTYYPATAWDAENKVVAACFQVLRFADDNPVTVTVREPSPGNAVKAVVDLKGHMEKNGISVDGRHEAAVSLLIEFTDLGVTVTIPDWSTSITEPEI